MSKLDEVLPKCVDPHCDNNGSTMSGTFDEPEQAQCQYCYEQRFPAKQKIKDLMLELLSEFDGAMWSDTYEDIRKKVSEL